MVIRNNDKEYINFTKSTIIIDTSYLVQEKNNNFNNISMDKTISLNQI